MVFPLNGVKVTNNFRGEDKRVSLRADHDQNYSLYSGSVNNRGQRQLRQRPNGLELSRSAGHGMATPY